MYYDLDGVPWTLQVWRLSTWIPDKSISCEKDCLKRRSSLEKKY